MAGKTPEIVTPAAKRIALIVATFGSFMTSFDGSMDTMALPSIGKELGGAVSRGPGAKLPADAFMRGMHSALTILALICTAGIITSLVRGRIRAASPL